MSNTEETHDFYKDAQVLLESVLQELLLRVNLLRRYQMLAGERDPVDFFRLDYFFRCIYNEMRIRMET